MDSQEATLRWYLMSLNSLFLFANLISIQPNIVSCLPHNERVAYPGPCKTDACQRVALTILERMNRCINKCDDFYQFVCGNFAKQVSVPPDRFEYDVLVQIQDKIDKQLLHSISEEDPNGSEVFKNLRLYYKTCKNKDERSDSGVTDLKYLFKTLGWPLLVGVFWDESKFDWKQLKAEFRKAGLGHDHLMSLKVEYDEAGRHGRMIFIDPPLVSLRWKHFDDIGNQTHSLENMLRLAELFGVDREHAASELREVYKLMLKLAQISEPPMGSVDEVFVHTTVGGLHEIFPGIDWFTYMKGVLTPSMLVKISDNVTVFHPDYFRNLSRILATVSNKTLANYLFYSEAKDFAEYTNIYEQWRGSSQAANEEQKSLYCLDQVKKNMKTALSALYIENYYDDTKSEATLKILHWLKETFRRSLKNSAWMDGTTKAATINKLLNEQIMVAYPRELLDNEKLYKFYKFLVVHPESFFKTQLSVNRLNTALRYEAGSKISSSYDNVLDFGDTSSTLVRLSRATNKLFIPAGFLQKVVHEKTYPKYLIFGDPGVTIAREMTRTFDEVGHLFDANGNLANLWTPNSEAEYRRRSKCLTDQYEKNTTQELYSEASQYFGDESIADNVGLKMAYSAYERWLSLSGDDYRLPVLDQYTPKQMFWIAFASSRCSKYSDRGFEFWEEQYGFVLNSHRVNGPLSARPEFFKDFNCSDDSLMAKKGKCDDIW